jgi:hypothetical protein
MQPQLRRAQLVAGWFMPFDCLCMVRLLSQVGILMCRQEPCLQHPQLLLQCLQLRKRKALQTMKEIRLQKKETSTRGTHCKTRGAAHCISGS